MVNEGGLCQCHRTPRYDRLSKRAVHTTSRSSYQFLSLSTSTLFLSEVLRERNWYDHDNPARENLFVVEVVIEVALVLICVA